MEANNIRDIKEALLKVSAIANFTGMVMSPESAIEEIREILKPISAIHIRNCDVGTAHEQKERFNKFCTEHTDPMDIDGWRCDKECPLYKNRPDCQLLWAQMPYEEGGEK